MKKTVKSVLLAFAALLLVCSMLACQGNTPTGGESTLTGESENSADIGGKEFLSPYTIIYASSLGDDGSKIAGEFRQSLRTAIDVNLKVGSDTADPNAYEILIGDTSRPQSATAKQALSNFGYVIGVYDGQIVINASNTYFLQTAIDRFFQEIATAENGLQLPKTPLVVNQAVYSVASDGKNGYGIVYDEYYAEEVGVLLQQISDKTKVTIPNVSKLKPGVMEFEILVGDTNRPESESVLSEIDYDEAIVAVVNKKIVVRGWNETTTRVALSYFGELLDQWCAGQEGYFVPDNACAIKSVADSWGVEIPAYLDGKVSASHAVGQENYLVCVENTSKEAYQAYRTQLEADGYTLYMQNELNGNLFATYTSESTMLHTYFVNYDSSVRLVAAPMNKTKLPPDVTRPEVVKTHQSTITQMILDYYYYDPSDPDSTSDGNYGNCYILVLDDGSLMIYDGGGRYSDNDSERLWNLIQELGTRNANGKIEIAAWFITHEHTDHFWCSSEVFLNHGSEFELETVYCNVVSDEMRQYSGQGDGFIESLRMNAVKMAVGDFDIVRVHTGQKFWVRNAQIEILYTPEDLYPHNIKNFTDFNDSSVISRITVDGTSFMMAGDAYYNASEIAVKMYGNTLKSDICQIAHHGWGGCKIEFYDAVDPEFYMMPFSEKAFRAILDETSYIDWAIKRYGAFQKVLQHIVEEVGEDGVYRADHHNKTIVFATKEVIIRETNNYQPGYPWGDKSQYK